MGLPGIATGVIAAVVALGLPSTRVAADAPPLASPGERLFLQCRACHALRAGEPHGQGPNLARFFGRPAASAEGFAYSAALRKSGLLWDEPSLDRWLENPAALVPGTAMAFAGMPDAARRRVLIEWLEAASSQP